MVRASNHGKNLGLIESLEPRRMLTADLAASMSVTVKGYNPGDIIDGSFTLKNLGTSTIKTGFTVDFRLSNNTTYGDSDDQGDVQVPVSLHIPPGTYPVAVQVQIPVPINIKPGSYYIVGKVDSGNTVKETNENNNVFSTANLGAITINSGGPTMVEGTSAADTIIVSSSNGKIAVKINGKSTTYNGSVSIDGGAGNDSITIGDGVSGISVNGGDGDDYIVDGDGSNTLSGGAGKDKIYGGEGNDRLNGNGGNDKLFGEGGADRLYGGDGNDYLDGGSSNDRLEGDAGDDTMYGQSGDDKFYAKDNTGHDQLFGGSGTDSAQTDGLDTKSSIEEVLS